MVMVAGCLQGAQGPVHGVRHQCRGEDADQLPGHRGRDLAQELPLQVNVFSHTTHSKNHKKLECYNENYKAFARAQEDLMIKGSDWY